MAKKCLQRKTLELFVKVGDSATPEQINKHVGGTGSYFSKHISILRSWGYDFKLEKRGRVIVSYTLTSVPENDADYRISKRDQNKPAPVALKKARKVKAAPKAKAKKKLPTVSQKRGQAEVSADAEIKETNLDKMRRVLREKKERERELLAVLEDEPQATSYSVDADWDSTDNIDISELV